MSQPGPLVAIGGAEDKIGAKTILGRVLTLAGGTKARLAVIATASEVGPEVLDLYRLVFEALGADRVVGLAPATRTDAEAAGLSAAVDDATGVFLTGGNQLRLATVLVGTPLGAALRRAHARGAAIAGTSAGASALSEHMISFGSPGATPKNRMAQLTPGLGLLPGVIVDQHFGQRNRIGRLLSVVAASPAELGLGIDEDTAGVIHHNVLEVVGRGVVTVVDGRAAATNVALARRSGPLLVSGAILHTLPAGASFDLAQRRLASAYDISPTGRGGARRPAE